MTPNSKRRFLSILGIVIAVAVTAAVFRGADRPQTGPDNAMFMGLRQASAEEVRLAFAGTADTPLLINFSSRFCLDCKKMKPIVEEAVAGFPDVKYVTLDIMRDREKHAAVFNTLQPVSVPTFVFVNADGDIENVLYNTQPREAIRMALESISPTAGAGT